MKNRPLVFFFAVSLLLIFSVLSVTLWLALRASKPPQLPEVDLTELDPDVAEAIAEAQDKVRQQPKNGAAWGRLGMVFLAHDLHEQAQSSFEQAEHFDPNDGRWPYLHGLSLILTQPDAGIPCLQRAAKLCGKETLAPRLRLAGTLLIQGRLDEAERHLEWARKADPDNPRVQLTLGRLAVMRGQWRQAVEQLEPCTQDAHARRMAHTLLAEVWTRLGDSDKASQEQRQAEETPEDQPWPDPFVEEVVSLQRGLSVRLQRANELFTQQKSQQAVEMLEETSRRYPHSSAVWLLLGDFWRKLGSLDRAEEAFAEAVRIDPVSVDGWFRLGCIQAMRGRSREGADSFRRTIRLKPDHTDALVNLGHCLEKVGDAAGAADAFRTALRSRPNSERAQQALRDMEKKK
jgi:cytochrome c-type biogenesis protein CcmH/NrfG